MRTITLLFSAFNALFGVVAILPCLMAGLMSMDSPQAQHSVVSHIVCYAVLSFPLVCWVCSFLGTWLVDTRPRLAFCVSLSPVCIAAVFFGVLYFLQWLGGTQ